MVAPKGRVKDATELLIPNLFRAVSMVTGSVALLLEVLNANKAASRIFFSRTTGLKPLKSLSNIE